MHEHSCARLNDVSELAGCKSHAEKADLKGWVKKTACMWMKGVEEERKKEKKTAFVWKDFILFYKTFAVIVYQQASAANDHSHTVIIWLNNKTKSSNWELS